MMSVAQTFACKVLDERDTSAPLVLVVPEGDLDDVKKMVSATLNGITKIHQHRTWTLIEGGSVSVIPLAEGFPAEVDEGSATVCMTAFTGTMTPSQLADLKRWVHWKNPVKVEAMDRPERASRSIGGIYTTTSMGCATVMHDEILLGKLTSFNAEALKKIQMEELPVIGKGFGYVTYESQIPIRYLTTS